MVRKAKPETGSSGEQAGGRFVIERGDLPALWRALESGGYAVVGPTVRDGAIVYDRLASVEELPAGWTEEQDGGRYRLKHRDDEALFGYVVGPQSWKAFLHPPRLRLWRGRRESPGFAVEADEEEAPRYAFLGVRPCELAAIAIQDRVFLGGAFADPHYRRRREGVFLVALNCAEPGGTCFCASMNTGPAATSGFDLALSEFAAPGRHHFVVQAGSPRGAEVLREVPHREAAAEEREAAESQASQAAGRMGRALATDGLPQLLQASYDHPRWADVARRCLTCGNCTLVCPTCFCSAVEDRTDLSGQRLERWRRWDSCFTLEFSYLFGGSVRTSAAARYRQWLTHKLGTWHDQFGSSGCVGCGRCITWCPVGIDITEEVRALRATASGRPAAPHGQGGLP